MWFLMDQEVRQNAACFRHQPYLGIVDCVARVLKMLLPSREHYTREVFPRSTLKCSRGYSGDISVEGLKYSVNNMDQQSI